MKRKGSWFPKCKEIAKKIGDNRTDKVVYEIFCREKEAYECDEKEYNKRIEEVQARVDYRHGIIMEVKNLGFDHTEDEPLALLMAAEQDDLGEIWRLMQMSNTAGLRVAEKSRILKKMKIVVLF